MRATINPENVTTETIAKDGERLITTRITLLDTVEPTERGDEVAAVEIVTYFRDKYVRQTVNRVTVRGGFIRHTISIGGDVDACPLRTRGQRMERFSRKTLTELHEYYVADALDPEVYARLLTWGSFVRPRYVIHFEDGDYKTIALSTNSLEEAERRQKSLLADKPNATAEIIDTTLVDA